MHIVLHHPEIPQNTGNISRTCAATGASLHLIEPLGFSLEDKYLKRAGLDYWHLLDLHIHASLEDLFAQYPNAPFFYASTKAKYGYADIAYPKDAFLVFGCETKGLPETLLRQNISSCMRIPMKEEARSLNLSNSVAVVLFEALRQHDFEGLLNQGSLSTQ